MPLLLQADVAASTFSEEVTVVPNTLVSFNADGPVAIYAENGSGGFVRVFTTEDDGRSPVRAATFVATSDTIKLQAIHDDVHLTIYGD